MPLRWLYMRLQLVPARVSLGLAIIKTGQSIFSLLKILSSLRLNFSKFWNVEPTKIITPYPNIFGKFVSCVNWDTNISWRLWKGLSKMSPSAFPYFDWYRSEVTAPMLLPQRYSLFCDHFLSHLTIGTTC